jgi:hypothetical protein
VSDLAEFQDAFMAALAGDHQALARWTGRGAPGLAVYRNTWLKGGIDALEANFPAVARLVGSEWFRAAAREFAEQNPPTTGALHAYGWGFDEWLAAFPPAAALPYLPAVAGLDWLWLQSFFAADAEAVSAAGLGRLDAQDLELTAARLHPAVRLAWRPDNSPSLWLATRWPSEPPAELEFIPSPQGVVIARPDGGVLARIVGAAEFAFLEACRQGRPLAEAARSALAEGGDLAAIMSRALEEGLFVALETVR